MTLLLPGGHHTPLTLVAAILEYLLRKDAIVRNELSAPPRYFVNTRTVNHIQEGLNLPTLPLGQRNSRVLLMSSRRCNHPTPRFVKRSHRNASATGSSQLIEVLNDIVPRTHVDLWTARELKHERAVSCHKTSFR
jgi:hypothetical protein